MKKFVSSKLNTLNIEANVLYVFYACSVKINSEKRMCPLGENL